MSRPGIEYESVERVACQLLSQGQNPSVSKVRDVLKTGSNTTIARHLKSWQANFASKSTSPLPEHVPEDLMNPLDTFWSLALEKAEANYQQFREESEAKLEAAVTAQVESIMELEEKSRQIDTLQAEISVLKDSLRDIELQMSHLQGEHSSQRDELTKVYQEKEQLHALLADQQDAFSKESQRVAHEHENSLQYEQERASTTENRLLNEIDQLRQETKSLLAKQEQMQSDFNAYKKDSHQREIVLHKTNTDLISDNKRLETQCTHHKTDAEAVKQQLADLQAQLSKALGTVDALRQTNEESKTNEIRLTKKIGELNGMVIELQSIIRGQDDEHTNED